MTSQIERQGYTAREEFRFSESGIVRVSARHGVGNPTAAGSLTVDRIAADGKSLERQSWWLNVDPTFAAVFTPNLKV